MQVSVIIPVRDDARFLTQSVQSVLNRTRPAHQIIVVDAGSRDASPRIARAYGAPIQPVRGSFGGAAAARIAGLGRATGDAIMYLDADDLVGTDMLAALVAISDRHPGAIACCDWMRYERIGRTRQTRPTSSATRAPARHRFRRG